jgi:hypothetical protein
MTIYGRLDLTRDKAGLEAAQALKLVLGATVKALESEKDLPDHVVDPEPTTTVKNPFE